MKKILLLIILGLFSQSSFSKDDSSVVLSQFFNDLKTITANFEQTVHNSQLSSSEKASGKLWISRPGKFRWDYLSPYEQEIVSDGNKLWLFDKDLEQVTVRSMSGSIENTPAVLLSDSKPLSDAFRINVVGKKGLLDWVELFPKDPEASFSVIRLGFDGKILAEMLLEDNLGQTTLLKFSDLKRNATIEANQFVFVPPVDVDVFESGE